VWFRVSTLDLTDLPRTPEGKVDFAQDFFGREAFLTVSGQLNVEAYCLALTKVYTFGPTFRAENSNTSRHLAEFWMIEPEIAFADLSDNAALAEALLKYTFAALLSERQEDLAFFDERIEKGLVTKLEGIVGSEFVHMDYGEAIQVLERANEKFEFPVKWGIDLQSEHERYLTGAAYGGRLTADRPRRLRTPRAPIHIVHPEGRYLPAKVRLFLDHAAEGLRRKFGPQVETYMGPTCP
jgi:asparaginyl-tRNA synthetase